MNIFDWAVSTTKNSEWEMSRFHKFAKNATQEEFLKSQEPFFYAVQAFPTFLCFVAGNIETSEDRLKIVENIWEEHGLGNKAGFHSNSYMTYLKALGYQKDTLPNNNNPWVKNWLDKTTETCLTASAALSSAYLAGIEYAYALICTDVTKYIETLDLKCEQSHYKKHSELDWEHGKELLEVAMSLSEKQGFSEVEIKYAFLDGQQFFIRTYNALYMPTVKEIETIGEEKIAFYYSREDSQGVNANVLEQLEKKNGENVNVLMIASGGEHVFELLKYSNVKIDAIDINPHQIELSKNKLEAVKNNPSSNILTENSVGKFEKMFELLRSYFTSEEIYQLRLNKEIANIKLKFLLSYLFSNESLNKVFTDQATMYTTKSFEEHFMNTFSKKLQEKKLENNIGNVFYGYDVRDWKALSKQINNAKNSDVEWILSHPKDFVSEKKYDVIDISNIGDWMSQEDFSNVLTNLKKFLNVGSVVIVRKLLGDYELKNVLESHGLIAKEMIDETMFYSESYSAVLI